jgi:hypothetical protein
LTGGCCSEVVLVLNLLGRDLGWSLLTGGCCSEVVVSTGLTACVLKFFKKLDSAFCYLEIKGERKGRNTIIEKSPDLYFFCFFFFFVVVVVVVKKVNLFFFSFLNDFYAACS